MTIRNLADTYIENQRESGVRPTTITKATQQVEVIGELWGDETPLSELSRDHGVQLIDLLKRKPTNGRKRYPGKSLMQMSKLEAKQEKPDWISPKTVYDYFNGISAIIRFAEDEGWLERNPLSSRSVRKRLPSAERVAKPMMTPEDLNEILKDQRYLCERKKGERGAARFWVPLLCLFHGVRSNEACQLLVEDVREEEGIPFIDLRPGDEEGEHVKRFKTGSSVRRIPLHDEVIRIGFLDFVEAQRKRGETWLFSGLKENSMGSRADAVGKWFGRFRKECLGDGVSEVKGAKGLHSFRHLFERTLRGAGISDSLQFALGGWADKKVLLHRFFKEWVSHIQLEDASYSELLEEVESALLSELLERFDKKPTRMANALSMNRSTLRKKLNRQSS